MKELDIRQGQSILFATLAQNAKYDKYVALVDKIATQYDDEELKEPVISKSHLKTYIDAYAKGWIFGIAACAISEEVKDRRRTNCQSVLQEFRRLNNID